MKKEVAFVHLFFVPAEREQRPMAGRKRMGMEKNLASLLIIEGEATDQSDLDLRLGSAGLYTFAIDVGYYDAMVAVINRYKPAARMRQLNPEGFNLSGESVAAFAAACTHFLELHARIQDPSVVKALILHNAASCLGVGNGNDLESQNRMNHMALEMLETLSRQPGFELGDPDWTIVQAKVNVGLYESGGHPFHEIGYRACIDMMEVLDSKDAAGRRLFLAKWLMHQGRNHDAIEALRPVSADDYVSAPNQLAAARAYLAQLMEVVR